MRFNPKVFLYFVGLGYLGASILSIALERSFTAVIPLVCWGFDPGRCYSNFSTTMAIFATLLIYLVHRDGWRGAPEAVIAGVVLDIYWSLATPEFMAYHPWNYPVWAALLAPALWFSRPLKVDVLNWYMFAFFALFYINISWLPPNTFLHLLSAPLTQEGPVEVFWCVAFIRSIKPDVPDEDVPEEVDRGSKNSRHWDCHEVVDPEPAREDEEYREVHSESYERDEDELRALSERS